MDGIDPCEIDRSPGQNNIATFAFQSINEDDAKKIIKSLPSNKAPGCDKVNAKTLKNSLSVIAPVISSLINNSFHSSSFPLSWKRQKSFQFSNRGIARSLRTRDLFRYYLNYLKCAKGQRTHNLLISSARTILYIICRVEIENFIQLNLRYFTLLMNYLITWIRGRYLSLFFWTCPKLLIVFSMT